MKFCFCECSRSRLSKEVLNDSKPFPGCSQGRLNWALLYQRLRQKSTRFLPVWTAKLILLWYLSKVLAMVKMDQQIVESYWSSGGVSVPARSISFSLFTPPGRPLLAVFPPFRARDPASSLFPSPLHPSQIYNCCSASIPSDTLLPLTSCLSAPLPTWHCTVPARPGLHPPAALEQRAVGMGQCCCSRASLWLFPCGKWKATALPMSKAYTCNRLFWCLCLLHYKMLSLILFNVFLHSNLHCIWCSTFKQ